MKYSFYIEGGDNVGKTTTIQYLQENNVLNHYMKPIIYSKYPTSNMTEYMNIVNTDLKVLKANKENNIISEDLFNRLVYSNIENCIYVLLNDMKDSIINTDMDTIQICDRGMLSTFLYQYIKLIKKSTGNFVDLINFINMINKYMDNDPVFNKSQKSVRTIIILYNNKTQEPIKTDKNETIDYKKTFDEDKNLQYSINTTLKEIVETQTNFAKTTGDINIRHINIYDNNGYRKSSEVICNEIDSIVNQVIYKHKESNTANLITSKIIYKNNHVANIYGACTACYNNTKSLPYMKKKEYIEKRINVGHDSILEHGRLAIKITNISNQWEIADLTTKTYSKYLEFYSITKDNGKHVLIINGTMRAYKYFFTNTIKQDYQINSLIRSIHYILINNTVGELYGTSFKMYDAKPKFVDQEYFPNDIDTKTTNDFMQYDTITTDAVIDIPTTNIYKPIKSVDIGIDLYWFRSLMGDVDITPEVLFNIISVEVIFKNMSRTATHQLVRHRNAITQESQRYVSASNASFTIPVENYSDNEKYDITLFDKTKCVNLRELASELLNVYNQLIDAGLKKEQARAFLPSNVNCGKLFMTFSLSNLLAFLKLRTDKHAQYEIRQYALVIKNVLLTTLRIFGIDFKLYD